VRWAAALSLASGIRRAAVLLLASGVRRAAVLLLASGVRRAAVLLLAAVCVAGCGATPAKLPRASATPLAKLRRAGGGIPRALLVAERPIGRGPRFQPPLAGAVPGACTARLGSRLQAHIEVFGANRVVLLPAGIGTGAPRRLADGRLIEAACFGELVTLDPTGTVYFRHGARLTVGDLFDAWGQRLTATRIATFGGGRVRVYVNGKRWLGSPRAVPLSDDAEVVLEVGPRVPPHIHFTFQRPPSADLR
jgi:hypothetical protein